VPDDQAQGRTRVGVEEEPVPFAWRDLVEDPHAVFQILGPQLDPRLGGEAGGELLAGQTLEDLWAVGHAGVEAGRMGRARFLGPSGGQTYHFGVRQRRIENAHPAERAAEP